MREGYSAPGYVKFLSIVTLVYLTFEMAFNAHLLDITGALSSVDDVTSVEHTGRLLSGVAIAIAVWGWGIFPLARRYEVSRFLTVCMLVISAGLCIKGAYSGEDRLVRHFVDISSGQQRREAVVLQQLTAMVHQDRISISGMDLTKNERLTPAGKAFMTVLPLEALSVDNLDGRVVDAIRNQVRQAVIKGAGDAAQQYNHDVLPLQDAPQKMYNGYVRAVNGYHDALNGISDAQDKAWDRYLHELAKHNFYPANVPSYAHGSVISSVRRQGVPVPSNWNPADQQTFYDSLERSIRTRAEGDFHRAMSRIAGSSDVSDNLSEKDFLALPGVSRKIATPANSDIHPGMSFEEYKRRVWQPGVDKEVSKRVEAMNLEPSHFEDGGDRESMGRDAMEAAIAAPLALIFSILGATLHLFKVTNYLLWWRRPAMRKSIRMTTIGAVVTVLLAIPFFRPNEVTRTHVFQALSEGVQKSYAAPYGSIIDSGLKWIVQTEPMAYPLFAAARFITPHF